MPDNDPVEIVARAFDDRSVPHVLLAFTESRDQLARAVIAALEKAGWRLVQRDATAPMKEEESG